jgi:plastocyanin domain-containing protein
MKRIAIRGAGFLLVGSAWILLFGGCQQSPSSQSGEVHIDVTDRGFEPADVKVAAGKAVTLVMMRKTDQTCVKEVLFPSLNQRYPLPLNQAVRIDIPANQKGTLSYQCGEKMIGGQVVIE